MFCPECGAENEDDAVFCGNCGADISEAFAEAQEVLKGQESPGIGADPVRRKEPVALQPAGYPYRPAAAAAGRKPIPKSVKIVGAVLLVLIAAGVALYNAGLKMTGPEKVASDYFATLRARDWSGAYSYLNVTENEFLNRSNFVKAMQKQDIPKIVNYSVSSEKSGSNLEDRNAAGDLSETVFIQYTTQENPTPQTASVVLIKQPGKQYLIFDSWKVSPVDFITPELTVTVPKGATVFLDNTQLGDKYKAEPDPADASSSLPDPNENGEPSNGTDRTVTYRLTSVFAGKYTLKVTSPYTDDFSKTIATQNEKYGETVDSLKLKDSVLKEVAKMPQKMIQSIYSSALSGANYDSVKSYFVTDTDIQSNMDTRYEEVVNTISKDTAGGFKSISFSDFDSGVTDAKAGAQTFVTVNTRFNYSYTAADQTYDAAAPAQEFPGTGSGEFNTTYQLVDGKWLISDLDSLTLSYYNNNY